MTNGLSLPAPRRKLRYISSLPDAAWRDQRPRTLAILGSTGSIGRSALAVLRLQPERFHVSALAGARNIPLLARQASEWKPDHLCVLEPPDIPALRSLLPAGYHPVILAGQEGYETLARLPGVSTVLSAQVGAAGLRATYAAAQAGKAIALANKESLVLAGRLIRSACAASGACILPVDSEHNAIFQCLAGLLAQESAHPGFRAPFTPEHEYSPAAIKDIARLILTASGGPFFGNTREELETVTVDQALAHPNWTMGAKITIDSATLMNKGLELIEAHHLYGLPLDALDVIVHRESIIHSLVEFSDGSQLAQLGQPDMRVPIAHCLGWPDRLETGVPRLDLTELASLSFSRPDPGAFPCLALAREALERGNGSPVVLNAANEEAVAAFLDKRIGFHDIPAIVEQCLAVHASGAYSEHNAASEPDSLEEILALDFEARERARELITRAELGIMTSGAYSP